MLKTKTLLTKEYLLKTLGTARKNLQKDGRLYPCIQFNTSENIGAVAFDSLGDDQIKAFLESGNAVEKEIGKRPIEAIFIGQVLTRKIELPKRLQGKNPEMVSSFVKENEDFSDFGVGETKEAITISGQNLGKDISVLVVQTFNQKNGKFIFDEPDLKIIKGSDAQINASMLDYFLEPEKAEFYKRITKLKIDSIRGLNKKGNNNELPN